MESGTDMESGTGLVVRPNSLTAVKLIPHRSGLNRVIPLQLFDDLSNGLGLAGVGLE
jgi:hypothetical protein